jgi:hypothetical protein
LKPEIAHYAAEAYDDTCSPWVTNVKSSIDTHRPGKAGRLDWPMHGTAATMDFYQALSIAHCLPTTNATHHRIIACKYLAQHF